MVIGFYIQALEEFHNLNARLTVKVSCWLVGKDHSEVIDNHAQSPHAAARPKARSACGAGGRPANQFQRFFGTATAYTCTFQVNQGQFHVREHGCPREQVEILEDEANFRSTNFGQLIVTQFADINTVKLVGAGGGHIRAANDIHECGFAAAAGAP